MNKELVKKLALECGAWHRVYESKRFMHDHNFDIERFAELMVQDCIRTLQNNGYDDAAQCLHDANFGMDYPV